MQNAARGTQGTCCCREAAVAERERKELIAAIVAFVRAESIPVEVRQAALTLIGWLARRRPEETACTRGLYEARKQAMTVAGGSR